MLLKPSSENQRLSLAGNWCAILLQVCPTIDIFNQMTYCAKQNWIHIAFLMPYLNWDMTRTFWKSPLCFRSFWESFPLPRLGAVIYPASFAWLHSQPPTDIFYQCFQRKKKKRINQKVVDAGMLLWKPHPQIHDIEIFWDIWDLFKLSVVWLGSQRRQKLSCWPCWITGTSRKLTNDDR